MPQFSSQVISLYKSALQVRSTAPDQVGHLLSVSYLVSSELMICALAQGGLLTGKDPTAFDPADPLRLWIIQVGQFDPPSLVFRRYPGIQCPLRYHHHHNSDIESWTPQATTTSGYCRGVRWYSSWCVICSFLLHVLTNMLSTRADCLWRYTRLFSTHIPLPVYTISLSCCEHRPLPLSLPRRA